MNQKSRSKILRICLYGLHRQYFLDRDTDFLWCQNENCWYDLGDKDKVKMILCGTKCKCGYLRWVHLPIDPFKFFLKINFFKSSFRIPLECQKV